MTTKSTAPMKAPASASVSTPTGFMLSKPDNLSIKWQYQLQHYCNLIMGFMLLLVLLPFVAVVVGTSTLWHHIDYVVFPTAQWINRVTAKFNSRFTRHHLDGFYINVVLLTGVVVPAMWGYCLYSTLMNGFSPWLAFGYNVLRIGPHFMNFAYVYTMCHKEGHSMVGLYKEPYNKYLRNVFNWWIGLFYGVLPSSFAYGHTRNHHKYNNGPLDILSTADRPRDSFLNYVAYLPRFFLYATNITTVHQFMQEDNYSYVLKMLYGNIWYGLWLWLSWAVNPYFCMFYMLYPLFENVMLLAAINWVWHAFINPADVKDEYVYSVTIIDGPINVLHEDHHVVHHKYPAAHWSNHPDLYLKHIDEYKDSMATIFREVHTLELFFLIILKKYDIMAEKFVDLSETLTYKEKLQLVKLRLRCCTWGPWCTIEKPFVQKVLKRYRPVLE